MCLEETLDCDINEGCLYYHSVNQRVIVPMTSALRQEVKELAAEMQEVYQSQMLPKAAYFKTVSFVL